MTAILAPIAPTIQTESLGGALSAIHDRWIPRLAALLSPAMTPHSRFWEGWEAARRFAGDFQEWLRMEYSLVETLGGRVAPPSRVRLATLRAALQRTSSELMDAAPHEWRPGGLALLSRRLLDLARCWCAELELVTEALSVEELPQPGRILLERMAR